MSIDAPLNVNATAGDTTVYLTWDQIVDPVPDVIAYEIATADELTSWEPANPTDTFRLMEGLADGVEVNYKVRGLGQDVQGTWSNIVSATPVHINVISAPVITSVVPGDTKAVVTWTAPDVQDVPVDYYYVADSTYTNFYPQNDPTVLSLEVDGLTNDVPISFVVRGDGLNSMPIGEYSTPSDPVTPTHIPQISAPIVESVFPGDAMVTVNWNAPLIVDEAIVQYTVWDSTLTNEWTQPNPSLGTLDVTGLPNDVPISFVIRAQGTTLVSDYSDPSQTVTPIHIPVISAPTITSVVPGDGKVTLTWSMPDTVEVPITSWTVTPASDFGNSIVWTQNDLPATSLEIDGLNNDIPYSFLVRGEGDSVIGMHVVGDWSDPSSWVSLSAPIITTILGIVMPNFGDVGWNIPLIEVLQAIETALQGQGGSGESPMPTAIVGDHAGTGAEDPIVRSDSLDHCGSVTFGTGVGATPGEMVYVTLGTPLSGTPHVLVSSDKLGTVPFVENVTGTGFSISVPYPIDDLNNDAYSVTWLVIE